ncbi:MAG TPA: multicopper oxidase domain-containing protein, partial [Candidatus Absconditabacterales bacterium]|nr:multicopper oxidase domain-containing protein [Candidatus Absconditabacterales bacterium]
IHVSPKSSKNNFLANFQKLFSQEKLTAEINSYRKYFDKPVDKTLILDMAMNMNHGAMAEESESGAKKGETIKMPGLVYDAGSIEREDTMKMMNDMSNNKNTSWKLIDTETKKENMAIHRSFKKGDLIKVRVINKGDSAHPMQHPIHFHGQRFLVLSHNGTKNTNLARKDTVLLGAGDSVDLLIDMSNPGSRMAHCHIAEHLMNGMMLHYTVK